MGNIRTFDMIVIKMFIDKSIFKHGSIYQRAGSLTFDRGTSLHPMSCQVNHEQSLRSDVTCLVGILVRSIGGDVQMTSALRGERGG